MSTYMTLEEYTATLKGRKRNKRKNFKNHQKQDDLFEKHKYSDFK